MAEVWLVWLRDGEYGDTLLMDPAHRTREGAMGWCNENRKLERGDPITWMAHAGWDEGVSQHVKLDVGKGKEHVTIRFYSLQVMKLEE